MKNHRIIAAGLICCLLCVFNVQMSGAEQTVPLNAAQESPAAANASKDETVYARLTANGQAEAVYVVNHVTDGVDYGNYSRVLNLTNTEPITLNGDEVTFGTDARDFYYQGYMSDNSLPWSYDIKFFLDGSEANPAQLGGQSGRIEIRIGISKNAGVNPVFAEHYMQQISLTVNPEVLRSMDAPGAILANNGKNRVLTYTVLPGNEAAFTITADARNFEMPGIDITAMPFNMDIEIPETDGMLDDFTLLTDAIADLNDGVRELNDGAVTMRDGAALLADGSNEFNDGLTLLGNGSAELTGASARIRDALAEMSASLSATDFSAMMPDLSEAGQLPVAFTQIADGLGLLSTRMAELNDGYSQAFTALDAAINAIPDAALTEEEIMGLYALTAGEAAGQAALAQLVEGYTAAATVKGTYAQVRDAFAAVSSALTPMAENIGTTSQALSEISSQISAMLEGLATQEDPAAGLQLLTDGLAELSANYGQFHNGFAEYADGVVQLAGGYPSLNDGVTELSDGIGQMADGINELYEGTTEMADETAALPDTVQAEIDSLTDEYSAILGAEFTPVSFASERNENVSFVQFVFKTAAVELPKADTPDNIAEGPQTFFERLLDLFR